MGESGNRPPVTGVSSPDIIHYNVAKGLLNARSVLRVRLVGRLVQVPIWKCSEVIFPEGCVRTSEFTHPYLCSFLVRERAKVGKLRRGFHVKSRRMYAMAILGNNRVVIEREHLGHHRPNGYITSPNGFEEV